jgi:hypothetical protein
MMHHKNKNKGKKKILNQNSWWVVGFVPLRIEMKASGGPILFIYFGNKEKPSL